MQTTVIVVGGGIGGLATALALHDRGVSCRVYEQSPEIRELGVGINTLPHAIGELAALGLLDRLDAVGLRTYELIYMNRFGQEIWRELRGLDAGHPVPQFSIHRGALQRVLKAAVIERLGPQAIQTGRRLTGFTQDHHGVTAEFADRDGQLAETVNAAALVGADGIHSTVREVLKPDEGPPRWNGIMLWRGATDWPVFLTGRSMIIAGGMEAKVVLYPIAPGNGPTRLTNWAVMARIGAEGDMPPRRVDWSRPGRLDEVLPHVKRFDVKEVDVERLIRETPVFWEYPVCDRDPIPAWSQGRVTLLGDAAHAMYPVGSNGASQAILDAVALADALRQTDDNTVTALKRYEDQRLKPTAEIVRSNRTGGPEGVIDAVEVLAPDGFDDVEAVLCHADREAIVRGYARKAGFAVPSPNNDQSTTERNSMTASAGPDVIAADASIDSIEWSILGQTYRPKQLTDRSFAWHATLPPDTFVPPHIHPTQDEYVFMIDGELTLVTGDDERKARGGDLVRLPMGQPHGLFNRSGATLTCLFWVTPTGKLYDLFAGIDAMAEQTPDAVVALSAEHEVNFLPPPE